MADLRWLAALPYVGILGGIFVANRVTPYVFGLPFILAWLVLWVLLTAAIMAVIYAADPHNREPDTDAERRT